MLLTSCIIAQDSSSYISRAVESVRNISDEIIVIDRGSLDNTVMWAEGQGLKVLRARESYNTNTALQQGLTAANGDWILLLGADEELADDYKQLRSLLKQTKNQGFYLPIMEDKGRKKSYPVPNLNLRIFKKEISKNSDGNLLNPLNKADLIDNNIKFRVLQLPIIHHINNSFPENLVSSELRPTKIYYLEIDDDLDTSSSSFLNLKRGITYFWKGRLNAALDEFFKGLKKSENGETSLILWKNIVLILLEQKKYSRAEKVLKKIVTICYDNLIFNFWSGYISYIKKDYYAAFNILQGLIGRKNLPEKIRTYCYLLLSLVFKEQGKRSESLLYLKKTAKYLPGSKLVINNFLDLLPQTGVIELHRQIYELTKTESKVYPALLVEVLYERGKHQEALELLRYYSSSFNDNYIKYKKDIICYWQGKVMMQLEKYLDARNNLQDISPGFFNYGEVLDLLWVNNILYNGGKESRSVVNQIKLMGQELAWKVIKIFNNIYFEGREIIIQFNNLVTKNSFYKKCLYYLDLLLEFGSKDPIDIMIDIIKKINIRSMETDLGCLFYFYKDWERTYQYLLLDVKKNQGLKNTILLAVSCQYLNRNHERDVLLNKVHLIHPEYLHYNLEFCESGSINTRFF